MFYNCRATGFRIVLLMVVIGLAMWSRGMGAPPATPAGPRGAASPSATTRAASSQSMPAGRTLEAIISAWSSGERTSAASAFLAIDWNRPSFEAGSIFGLKESEFRALSPGAQAERRQEILSQLEGLKGLVGYVLSTAIADAAAGKQAQARCALERVAACGQTFLNQPDGLVITQMVGQSFVRKALSELAKLP